MALRFELKEELPPRIAVGGGTVRLVRGWAYDTEEAISDLSISVDGEETPVEAEGMPRGDILARMYPESDPQGNSFRSGFWALFPLGPADSPREVRFELVARLRSGAVRRGDLGAVELLREPAGTTETAPAGKTIAIAMATFDPDPELFEAQVESIRAQTTTDWICVISDDLSRPDRFEEIERIVGGDERFRVSRGESRLGFYRNFERALTLVPPDAEMIALSDQDDRWHPDKLEALRAEIESGAELAYSDMRIVQPGGAVVAETYWTARPNGTGRLDELLIANSVSGAASMFSAEVARAAIPFPQAFHDSFHDQWIAAVALCHGEISFLKRPLYDYVQHDENVLGHKEDSLGIGSRGRLRRWRKDRPTGVSRRARLGLTLRRWEKIYFGQIERMAVGARSLERRFGETLSADRRRELARVAALDTTRGLLWSAGRRLSRPATRSPTMGNESNLVKALLWRRLLGARGRLPRPKGGSLGSVTGAEADHVNAMDVIDVIRDKLAPLNLDVSADAPARVNVLIPFVDLDHLFAGYIGMFNLARGLAQRGMRVRVVSVEAPPAPLPSDWRERLSRYDGLAEIGGLVEFESAADRTRPLAVSREDNFVSMSCWAAQLAHGACQQIGRGRFLFAIQEYEPFFHPMGSLAALTAASYELPHTALFSSETLRAYFRQERIGVYREREEAGERLSVSFENALTELPPPSESEMRRAGKRLLFYARPESHAARNMYELGHMALAEMIEEGTLGEDWELYGVGSGHSGSIELAKGRSLRLISRLGQEEYAQVLRSCSVGLSLMLTPHPSLVPLEMASAGLVTVTNSFATKTPERLAELSANLIAAAPTIEGIKSAVTEAIGRSEDYDARLRGSQVNWAHSWAEALPEDLLARVQQLLAED